MVTGWKTATVKETSTIFGRIGFRGYTKEDIVDAYEGAISLSPSNLKDGKVDITNSTFISWDKYNESPEIKLQDGDVVLVKTGSTYGKSAYVDNLKWATTLNPQIVVFKNVKINKKLFAYFVQTPEFQKQIEATIVGGAIPTLSQNQVYQFEITFPIDVGEQQRIAEALSDVDELISSLEKLIEKYKSIKATCLQQMFPQKGETTPKMRLPGFTGAWEQRKFSEIVEIRRGLTYKPSDICENGVRVLRSSNIDDDSFVLRDDDVFVKAEAVNIDYTKENDILITAANGSSRLVGKHAIIGQVSPKSTVHGGFMLLGATKEPYFVNASMSSSWYRHFIELFVAGGNGAIGNLNKNDLDNQDILVPSEEERQIIGAFFKQLDHLITLHQRKLDKAKKIKQGMMQQLLTGKIRLV